VIGTQEEYIYAAGVDFFSIRAAGVDIKNLKIYSQSMVHHKERQQVSQFLVPTTS
jgi:hypothetical protein